MPKTIISLLLIIFVGIASYSNTFSSPFVFDDLSTFVNNPSLHNINNIGKIWQFTPSRFITNLSYAFNYNLTGNYVISYHIFNLSVHITTSLLVYWFATLLQRLIAYKQSNTLIPLFTALFFVAHPIQTQAVTYITQRAASMAALFYIASCIFFILSFASDLWGYKVKRLLSFLLSLLFGGLAFLSKEISYTLPLALILLYLLFIRKFHASKKVFLAILISFFLVFVFVYNTTHPSAPLQTNPIPAVSSQVGESITRTDYFFTQLNVVKTYIRLLLIPLNQNLDYNYPISQTLFEISTSASLILLVSLFFFAFVLVHKNRIAAFGILFFFLTLSVESSIFPIADVISEHRLYLPMVGFSIAIVGLLYQFITQKMAFSTKGFYIVGTGITFVLLLLTFHRNRVWADEIILWQDVVSKSPDKPRVHYNLGTAYFKKGQIDSAIYEYQQAIALYPSFSDAYNNLAVAWQQKDNNQEALNAYQRALQADEGNIVIHNNIGYLYMKMGRLDEAEKEFLQVLESKIDEPASYLGLGVLFIKKQEFEKAQDYLKKAIAQNNSLAEGYYNLGLVYVYYGKQSEAASLFEKALYYKPDLEQARINLLKLK